MKNIIIIFLIVVFFFAVIFAAYLAGFKLYFTSDRLISRANHLARMTFQRDIKVAKIDFSPFGKFTVRDFSMGAKGGFKNGTLISVKEASSRIMLINLMRREIVLKRFSVQDIHLRLNYENKRKFDYESFFYNVRFLFMSTGRRLGFVKKIEISPLKISNGSVDLLLDGGEIKFKNIICNANSFVAGRDFAGSVSFDFNFGSQTYGCDLKFAYDNTLKAVNITEISCKSLGLKAEGTIEFLSGGKIALNFIADGKKYFFDEILKNITGNDYLEGAELSSEEVRGAMIFFSDETVKNEAA